MADHPISDEARTATASIRGYYYQLLDTISRWANLTEGEALYCEGNEDVDVQSSDGEILSIQVKDLTGTISENSEPLYSAALNFLISFDWHHERGSKISFVFCTTARLVTARRPIIQHLIAEGEATKVDAFEALSKFIEHRAKRPKQNQPPETSQYERAKAALARIHGKGQLQEFVDSTSWAFGECSIDELKSRVRQTLQEFATARGYEPVDAVILSGRAFQEVLDAASANSIEQRRLDVLDLERLFIEQIASRESRKFSTDPGVRGCVYLWRSTIRGGVAVSLIAAFENVDTLISSFNTLTERNRSLPGESKTLAATFDDERVAALFASTPFAVFGYVSRVTTFQREGFLDVVHLLRQMSARRPINELAVFGCEGLEPNKLPQDTSPVISQASAEELPVQIVEQIGLALLQWATGTEDERTSRVLNYAGRKLRGVYDQRNGEYYSQSQWPFAT